MTEISTHVLDISRGTPAAGLGVQLLAATDDGGWTALGAAIADADGRVGAEALTAGAGEHAGAGVGLHRLVFACGDYQRGHGGTAFLEEVAVSFSVRQESRLHIPLLLSAYGLSIYRGS